MGAHAILISVRNKQAVGTTLPMAVVDRFRVNDGYPVRVSTSLKDHLREHFPREAKFMEMFDDAIIESDAHGQLCSWDVVFAEDKEGGYYFNYDNF